MVEMAIALGVLLLIILGAIDAIQIMMTQYAVNQAARAAAHQSALVGGLDSTSALNGANVKTAPGSVAQAARLILDGSMTTKSDKAKITVTCSPSPCRRYAAITVRLTYQDALWVPFGPFKLINADQTSTRAAEQDQQGASGGTGGTIPGGPTATPRPPTPTPRPSGPQIPATPTPQ
jgi:hypothetical protein